MRAYQGHSKAVNDCGKRASGAEPTIGRPYYPGCRYFERYLLHGTDRANAPLIYRDGILVGGEDGRRAHIHMVRRMKEWIDESRGKATWCGSAPKMASRSDLIAS